jgi:hypothetical protein
LRSILWTTGLVWVAHACSASPTARAADTAMRRQWCRSRRPNVRKVHPPLGVLALAPRLVELARRPAGGGVLPPAAASGSGRLGFDVAGRDRPGLRRVPPSPRSRTRRLGSRVQWKSDGPRSPGLPAAGMPRPAAYDVVLPPREGTLSPPPKVSAAIGEPQEELEKGEPPELGEHDRTRQALERGRGSVLLGAERGQLAACGSRMFRS